jgi:hypothetical protein
MNSAIQPYERLTSQNHILRKSVEAEGIDNIKFEAYSNQNIILFSKMLIS